MRNEQTDGMVVDLVKGTIFQQKGFGKIWLHFDKIAPNFITHAMFARKELLKDHPQEVREFLAAWFETIRYMRTHKADTVKIAAEQMHQPADIVATTYDVTMPAFSDTGRFEPKALAVLKRSFIQMGMLKKVPPMNTLYTEKYLPQGGQVVGSAR
jgi:ABC-type nitrate/sulfonate/bicarbonate transport system substrate-binding protein